MRSHRWKTGGDTPSYPTIGDLPPSADDGTVALITSGSGAGVWQYVGVVDGWPLGMWFPGYFASRITGYVNNDDVNHPYRISKSNGDIVTALIGTPANTTVGFDFVDGGVGNDSIVRNDGGSWIDEGYSAGDSVTVANANTVANDGTYPMLVVSASTIEVATGSLIADAADTTADFDWADRGWVRGEYIHSGGPGTIADHADGIQLVTPAGQWGQIALWQQLGSDLPDGAVFLVAEMHCVQAPSSRSQVGISFRDGNTYYYLLTWAWNDTENNIGIHRPHNWTDIRGVHVATPYERMFCTTAVGPLWSSTTNYLDPLIELWPASAAREDTSKVLRASQRWLSGWNGARYFGPWAHNDGTYVPQLIVKELHMFHLST